MSKVFLSAEWRKLIIANYTVNPVILNKFIPYKTELDLWNNLCYVSLVGFMFLNVKVKGIRIPFHVNFEEVNLRFYVKYRDKQSGEFKRGVVFIKEIVPKPLIVFVANTVYKENYASYKMSHEWKTKNDILMIKYSWEKDTKNFIMAEAKNKSSKIVDGSEEEFITEHYWGYTKENDSITSEYEVVHPKWEMYEVINYKIETDFGKVYGKEFEFLKNEKPLSVFLAEGSEVKVMEGKKI